VRLEALLRGAACSAKSTWGGVLQRGEQARRLQGVASLLARFGDLFNMPTHIKVRCDGCVVLWVDVFNMPTRIKVRCDGHVTRRSIRRACCGMICVAYPIWCGVFG
jgi:hypothetical protein